MNNPNIFASKNQTHSCSTSMTRDDYVVETMMTWTTSIAISILCLLAFVKLFFFPQAPRSMTKCCSFSVPSYLEDSLVPSFFLFFSYLYGAPGVSQALEREDNYLTEYAYKVIPLIIGLFAVLVGLDLLKIYSSSKVISKKAIWWICVLIYYGLAITGAIRQTEIFGVIDLRTLVSICGLVFLFVVYFIRAISSNCHRFHFLLKQSSLLLFIIGFTYDSLFFLTCGSYQAYRDCFEGCPLPTNANKKTALNFTLLVATFCWAWSEDSLPSVRRRRFSPNNDGDTVTSDDSSVESLEILKKDRPIIENVGIDLELGCSGGNNECPSFKEEEQSNPTESAVNSTLSEVGSSSTTVSTTSITTYI